MGGIKIKGLKELEKELQKRANMDAVKKVVRLNGAELQAKAQRNAPVDTGTLKGSINLGLSDGGLTAAVTPEAEYSAYVEYGTRYMEAQPYIRPAYREQKEQFKNDLKTLVR